jgi:ribosomal protein L7/L12
MTDVLQTLSRAMTRIAELEYKLDHLYRQLGIEEPPPAVQGVSPEVYQALAAGNKIEAIRIHREQTGMGLADAKRAVEGLAGEGQPRIIQ